MSNMDDLARDEKISLDRNATKGSRTAWPGRVRRFGCIPRRMLSRHRSRTVWPCEHHRPTGSSLEAGTRARRGPRARGRRRGRPRRGHVRGVGRAGRPARDHRLRHTDVRAGAGRLDQRPARRARRAGAARFPGRGRHLPGRADRVPSAARRGRGPREDAADRERGSAVPARRRGGRPRGGALPARRGVRLMAAVTVPLLLVLGFPVAWALSRRLSLGLLLATLVPALIATVAVMAMVVTGVPMLCWFAIGYLAQAVVLL